MGLSSTSRTLTLLAMRKLFLKLVYRAHTSVLSAFPAGLSFQNDLANGDAFVQGLAHVVHHECCYAGSDQRLHFHSGSGGCSGSRTNLDAIFAHLTRHINERERKLM